MQLDCFGQLGLDAVRLGLMGYGYHGCLYYELHCPECGTFRLIVPVSGAVSTRQPCPRCSALQCATILGHGFTKRHVPLSETVYLHGNGHFSSREYSAERYFRRMRFRRLLGEAHINRVGVR